jgi:hypothetical protein
MLGRRITAMSTKALVDRMKGVGLGLWGAFIELPTAVGVRAGMSLIPSRVRENQKAAEDLIKAWTDTRDSFQRAFAKGCTSPSKR